MATPRIMEPMLLAEIQCTADSLNAIYNVLSLLNNQLFYERS